MTRTRPGFRRDGSMRHATEVGPGGYTPRGACRATERAKGANRLLFGGVNSLNVLGLDEPSIRWSIIRPRTREPPFHLLAGDGTRLTSEPGTSTAGRLRGLVIALPDWFCPGFVHLHRPPLMRWWTSTTANSTSAGYAACWISPCPRPNRQRRSSAPPSPQPTGPAELAEIAVESSASRDVAPGGDSSNHRHPGGRMRRWLCPCVSTAFEAVVQAGQASPECHCRTHCSKLQASSPGTGPAPTSATLQTSPRRGPWSPAPRTTARPPIPGRSTPRCTRHRCVDRPQGRPSRRPPTARPPPGGTVLPAAADRGPAGSPAATRAAADRRLPRGRGRTRC